MWGFADRLQQINILKMNQLNLTFTIKELSYNFRNTGEIFKMLLKILLPSPSNTEIQPETLVN